MASISGARGVLVVGGATGDDVVEFLNWEVKTKWRVLGKLELDTFAQLGMIYIDKK